VGPQRRPLGGRNPTARRLRSDLPTLRNIVAVNQAELARVETAIATTRQSVAAGHTRLGDLTRRRWLRRPDHDAITATQEDIHTHKRALGRLAEQRTAYARKLARNARRLHDTERAVTRLPDV
jgi:chromosome segregation ATPase